MLAQGGTVKLDAGGLEFLDDFQELTTDRTIHTFGFSHPISGPIPAASIREVAKKYGSEAHIFTRCIRAMDAVYLDIANEDPSKPKVDMSRTFGPGDMLQVGRKN